MGMKKIGDHNEDLHGNVPDTCSAALLLVDVLNDLDFPGAKPLIQAAPRLARNIAALKRRCRDATIPAIYVNDNRNQWRSDFCAVVNHCLGADLPITRQALNSRCGRLHRAQAQTFGIFCNAVRNTPFTSPYKDHHSCGANEGCLHSDDCLRDSYPRYQSVCPSDCVAASSNKQHKMALELMKKSFRTHTAASRKLDLKRILASTE